MAKNKLKDLLDINKDGKVDADDIKEATKKLPKWKLICYIICFGIFMLITNFGPIILEIFVK